MATQLTHFFVFSLVLSQLCSRL